MNAPTSAGIGALAKAAAGPRGMPSGSMQQIMATARKMSDAQLAEVLSGKSLDVPQYVAMTEAMGRKQLRTAMQGAEAQQQANQPSIKEKLMGEYAQEQAAQQAAQAPQMPQGGGIASLPAPTMSPQNMAGGGIVSFNEGGSAKERREKALEALNAALPEPVMPDDYKGTLTQFLSDPATQKAAKERQIAEEAIKRNIPIYSPQTMAQNAMPSGSIFSQSPAAAPAAAAAPPVQALPPVDNSNLKADDKGRFIAKAEDTKDTPSAPKAKATPRSSSEEAPKGLEDLFAAQQAKVKAAADERYKGLEDFGKAQREGIAALRSQGQGEIALNLAAAAFGTPNMNQMMAKGLPLVASGSSAMRKDIRDVEKSANEYEANLAKAKEAAANNDMKAYNEYMQNADMAKYHGMMGKAALMNAGTNASTAGQDNKMSIAIGNKVMGDVQDRLKTDIQFRNQWSKMSPEQQAAYYQQQLKIASSVYSGKMDSGAFGGPQVAFSKAQMDLLNKYN
jgi:hypothetical protein